MGSAGLSRIFFVFLIINRDGQHKVPAAVNGINRSEHLMLPAAVIPFSAAGTSARHGEATINRDLSFVADANAHCGRRKVPVTVNSCVVVESTLFNPIQGVVKSFHYKDEKHLRQSVSLLKSTSMTDSTPRLSIQQDPGVRRDQHYGNPVHPPPPKPHMLRHLEQEVPSNAVKGLCNIYFQYEAQRFQSMNRLASKLNLSDVVM